MFLIILCILPNLKPSSSPDEYSHLASFYKVHMYFSGVEEKPNTWFYSVFISSVWFISTAFMSCQQASVWHRMISKIFIPGGAAGIKPLHTRMIDAYGGSVACHNTAFILFYLAFL